MSILRKQNEVPIQTFQATTIQFPVHMTMEEMESAGAAAVEALALRGISARFAGGTRTPTTTGIDLLPDEVKCE